jgi:DNA-binding response OmpR family regulator
VAPSENLERQPTILVVDDNVVGSMIVEDALVENGMAVGGPFHTCQSASDWLANHPAPLGAIIDVRLSDGSSEPLARTLREQGVPFLYHTAWGGAAVAKSSPHVPKPSSSADLLAALKLLLAERLASQFPASNAG